jgi:TetR/AcrR family transcriptional repressor of nem operon
MSGARKFDTEVALDRAMELFREKGFAGTSMADIEKVTGLGRGSVYNAFGDKQALYLTVLARFASTGREMLKGMLSGAPTAIEGIRMVLRMSAVHCMSSHDRSGCLMGNATSERASSDEATKAVVERAFADLEELFRAQLVLAQEEGGFGADRDPQSTAKFLVMSMQGMNLMAKAADDGDQLGQLAEEILRVLD